VRKNFENIDWLKMLRVTTPATAVFDRCIDKKSGEKGSGIAMP